MECHIIGELLSHMHVKYNTVLVFHISLSGAGQLLSLVSRWSFAGEVLAALCAFGATPLCILRLTAAILLCCT